MNQYQQIRMYYEQQHKSIRWIARELHCSRDTVRKYIVSESVPWERKPGSGRRSVISDEGNRFIDACLTEDEQENLHKHTAKRIHDCIWQELGIVIGKSTIRGVVAKSGRIRSLPSSHWPSTPSRPCRATGAAPRPTSGATGWTSDTSVCANAPPVPCSSWPSCGRTRSPFWKPFRPACSSSAVRLGGSSLTMPGWALRRASAIMPRPRTAMRSWRPATPSAPTSATPQRAMRRIW